MSECLVEAVKHRLFTFNKKNLLSEEEKNFLESHCNKIVFNKYEYLIKEGETEKYICFIEEGIIRYTMMNSKQDETTFGFSFPGEFTTSFLLGTNIEKSSFNIQALSNTNIWRIMKRDILEIYSKSLNLNIVGRLIAEEIYNGQLKKILYLLNMSPQERYIDILQNNGILLNQIPLKYIASYLGITPQALSRIRKRICERKINSEK